MSARFWQSEAMAEKKYVLWVETGPDDGDRERHPAASEWKIVDGGALIVSLPGGSQIAYSPVGWRSVYLAEWTPPTRAY